MISIADARSQEHHRRALSRIPGGVNSPVRAMTAVGREHPLFIERGSGAVIHDIDGNPFIDYVCSWGPLIAGHAHPDVVEAITERARLGTTFGAPTQLDPAVPATDGTVSNSPRRSAGGCRRSR